nr:hypothetical protein [uncultured Schaedlerella sp.]
MRKLVTKIKNAAEGDTKGGISRDGKVLTVPLYLADRISFSLGKRCD